MPAAGDAVRRYTVAVERSDGYWVATVPDLPGVVTQARSLATSHRRLVEAVQLWLDIDEPVELELSDIEFGTAYDMDVVSAAWSARRYADEAQEAAMTAAVKAIDALAHEGIGQRDIGFLLGLSHQRVAQLAAER